MLFSKQIVAEFISRNFEPAWESVRPVPLVRIDFGNGTVVTRTLHGNIATYVCSSEGQVLDILPGIYTEPAFLACLDQFRLLANYVKQRKPGEREALVRDYHKQRGEALAKNELPPFFINIAGMSKRLIEGGVKAILVSGHRIEGSATTTKPGKPADSPKLSAREDLASWNLLVEDTRQNETIRRRQIHDKLKDATLIRPETVTRWLYKEVLHADLDDPYLGLGGVLFANYAFSAEDSAR